VTRSSMKASTSSRKISLGVPNFLALAWNMVRVLSDTRTVKYADLVGIMMETFFAVDVESVSQLRNNTPHATKFFSEKKKPRGLANPVATF
jgi:hypothetical protein